MSETASLHTFMSRVIDYAGLYPPANLPLEEAITNFVHYQSDPEVWMLSRFIIPARRLSELSPLADHIFSEERISSFSALGRSGNDVESFFDNLDIDLMDINRFRIEHGPKVLVDMFETVIPAVVLLESSTTDDLITETADILLIDDLIPVFEAPFGEGWESRVKTLIKSIQKLENVGFKLRTGGVEAHMFPSPEQVAWAIATARDAMIPMKATAGLHHPIRHYDENVKTKMHGFLNVFGAGILAHAKRLSVKQIESIIEDEDPSSFKFDEEGFSWKDISANNKQIAEARKSGLISFGSCSFDEPREDLQKLGLLHESKE